MSSSVVDKPDGYMSIQYIEWIRQVAAHVVGVCDLGRIEEEAIELAINSLVIIHKPGETYSVRGPGTIWMVIALLVGAMDEKFKKDKRHVALKRRIGGVKGMGSRYKLLNEFKIWAKDEAKRSVYDGWEEHRIAKSLIKKLPGRFEELDCNFNRVITETLKREKRGVQVDEDAFTDPFAVRVEYEGHMPLSYAYSFFMFELCMSLGKKTSEEILRQLQEWLEIERSAP